MNWLPSSDILISQLGHPLFKTYDDTSTTTLSWEHKAMVEPGMVRTIGDPRLKSLMTVQRGPWMRSIESPCMSSNLLSGSSNAGPELDHVAYSIGRWMFSKLLSTTLEVKLLSLDDARRSTILTVDLYCLGNGNRPKPYR